MRKILLLLLLSGLTAQAQPARLSREAKISIITCGPWQGELYSAFGHSAIRVHDPVSRIDDAYNYGVFDFNQPNFYLNYTKGLLLFQLGVYNYPDFKQAYISYNRSVTEQVLDLSQGQLQALYEYLEWNAQPENEVYRYDYFYNNCASKVRDVVAGVLKDSVQFDTTYLKTGYTIRQLTDMYSSKQPWGDLGIDICLGLPMDKVARPYEYMFLPDYVQQSFDHATILRNGARRPLVSETISVYKAVPEKKSIEWMHPWVVFIAFFMFTLWISYRDWQQNRISKWFDLVLFSVCGLIGILLVILWTATDHQAAARNFNLLWALPPHILVWLILSRNLGGIMKKYFMVTAVLEAAVLLTWAFLPQELNPFLIPFVLALALRAFILYRLLPEGREA